METGERIKRLRKSLGLSQDGLARQCGYTDRSSIAKIESGKVNLSEKKLIIFARVLGVPFSYLVGETDDPNDRSKTHWREVVEDIDSHPPKFDLQRFAATDKPYRRGVRIPVFGAVAAGIPIEAIEDIVDYEEIEPELAATGEFFGLRIKGSSMEPRICEGDVVIVRKQADADTGDVAIVLVNGYDATCKKLKKEASGLTLIPFNPAYEIKHYSPNEIASLPVRIIGKVVELRGKF